MAYFLILVPYSILHCSIRKGEFITSNLQARKQKAPQKKNNTNMDLRSAKEKRQQKLLLRDAREGPANFPVYPTWNFKQRGADSRKVNGSSDAVVKNKKAFVLPTLSTILEE